MGERHGHADEEVLQLHVVGEVARGDGTLVVGRKNLKVRAALLFIEAGVERLAQPVEHLDIGHRLNVPRVGGAAGFELLRSTGCGFALGHGKAPHGWPLFASLHHERGAGFLCCPESLGAHS